MEKKLDIEYCKYCEDVYATRPTAWLLFEEFSGETLNSSDIIFNCPRCNCNIRRYEGYLEALKRRESVSFIESVLTDITDLSEESLKDLEDLLNYFSVPSFAVVLDGDVFHRLSELSRKRYVTVERSMNYSIVTLNAFKLGLLDNKPLLLEMSHQRSFITNPEYIAKDNRHSLRRLARLDALVNDFTDEDKSELLRRFDGKCALTGKVVPLHFDHVIPIAIGHGGTTKSNMLPIWQRINSSKCDRNIFEWYEENGDRFDVCPKRFEAAIEYLAELNGMTTAEYRDYVNDCHANPNDVLTKETV